jgi:hypothetical protein
MATVAKYYYDGFCWKLTIVMSTDLFFAIYLHDDRKGNKTRRLRAFEVHFNLFRDSVGSTRVSVRFARVLHAFCTRFAAFCMMEVPRVVYGTHDVHRERCREMSQKVSQKIQTRFSISTGSGFGNTVENNEIGCLELTVSFRSCSQWKSR